MLDTNFYEKLTLTAVKTQVTNMLTKLEQEHLQAAVEAVLYAAMGGEVAERRLRWAVTERDSVQERLLRLRKLRAELDLVVP